MLGVKFPVLVLKLVASSLEPIKEIVGLFIDLRSLDDLFVAPPDTKYGEGYRRV